MPPPARSSPPPGRRRRPTSLTWKNCSREHAGELDAAFIITPHAYHHDQTVACLEAGLDVLLEKPMVMNAAEARSLIVGARPHRPAAGGGLPGQPLAANPHWPRSMLVSAASSAQLLRISGMVWQSWGPGTVGTWRQEPEISGGGFLFDTGAHMLNTVADLAGEDFDRGGRLAGRHPAARWTRSAAVIGRLASGAVRDAARLRRGDSLLRLGHPGLLHQGHPAHRRLGRAAGRSSATGDTAPAEVPVPPSLGVWEQFLAVRDGEMPNPCPPEVGLRMARLWDAIKASAAQGGMPVKCDELYGRSIFPLGDTPGGYYPNHFT